MQEDLKLQNYKITRLQNSQRGYMMITLMLALALMTIALLAVLPDIKTQVTRDREDEMRHRGTAYMRAIQHFYKKFGRFPTKVEELENTNNMRFLRKRYTDPVNRDPVTGKERNFKYLTQMDISLNNGPVLPGQTPGQGPGGTQSPFGGAPGGLGGQSPFGGAQGGPGGLGGQTGAVQQTGPTSDNSANGDSGNAGSGATAGNSPTGNAGGASGNSNAPGSTSTGPGGTSASGSGLNGQTFGGGPIMGVASTSKAKSIHIFYTKDHYNDWLFIYSPQFDRGGLLVGPINPGMPSGNLGGLTPGQMAGGAGGTTGQGGVGQGGFGQSGFGQSGFGQSGFGQGGLNGGQGVQPQTPQNQAPAPQQ